MPRTTWLKLGGVLVLGLVWQSPAVQGLGAGRPVSFVAGVWSVVGLVAALFLLFASDWLGRQLGWTDARRSHSLSRHQRNKRLLAEGFRAYTRRAGGLPEPPGGHDPEFLRAWVAGDYFLCERLVEMSGQEAANLPEDSEKAMRHVLYQEAFGSAREAVSRAAAIDPRTSSILDEVD